MLQNAKKRESEQGFVNSAPEERRPAGYCFITTQWAGKDRRDKEDSSTVPPSKEQTSSSTVIKALCVCVRVCVRRSLFELICRSILI